MLFAWQKRIIFASVIINKFGSACEEREKHFNYGQEKDNHHCFGRSLAPLCGIRLHGSILTCRRVRRKRKCWNWRKWIKGRWKTNMPVLPSSTDEMKTQINNDSLIVCLCISAISSGVRDCNKTIAFSKPTGTKDSKESDSDNLRTALKGYCL